MPSFEGTLPKGNIELQKKYPCANIGYEAVRSKNIYQKNQRDTSGFLDLFVWKKESFAFLEFKRRYDRNKESLTLPQKLWIKAAMTAKIDIEKQLFIASRV